jgi:hypothetical protein
MSSPKPRWTTRMGSVMRRTSSILTVSRPNTPSIASDKEADNASLLSGNIKAQPSVAAQVIAPSPILESPLGERAAEENAGLSLFAQPSTSSEPVPLIPVTSPPPVDDLQSPIGYMPPPVLDSTVGNPGAFTDEPDELPQPKIAKDPHALASVEPQVGPATVVPEVTPQHEPEPEALTDEALVEEPASYFDEPVAEIKDLQAADHVDDTIAFSEAVHETISFPEPDYGNGEAAEYYRGDVIPTTSEAVHQNVNVALPEPEAETHHHDGVIPVTTERQEESQQKAQPIVIPIPVPLPNYELSSYPMNFSSGEEVWGEEHGYGREGLHHPYPSSVPVIVPNPEDPKQVESGPAPNIRFVDIFFIR